MKEGENQPILTHEIKFLDKDEKADAYIGYTFNIVLTDTLLMFHICNLYHNCVKLIETGEIKESEIDDYITLNYVILSIQEALDNRIKCLSASYIDDAYKWCYERPEVFDICLSYFSKIKNIIKSHQNEYISINETER